MGSGVPAKTVCSFPQLESGKEIQMLKTGPFVFAVMIMLAGCGSNDEPEPTEIIEKTISTYNSMQTYKAQGAITLDVDASGVKINTETAFSILLKKPNLYLISWTKKTTQMPGKAQSGAVWSDGTQPYLYMGMKNAYSKMASDEIALGGATGISGGAAFTIPSIFFTAFKELPDPFSRLKNPKVERVEKVGKEDCYVLSGASTISQKEEFWISKSRYLILKYNRSLEPPEGGIAMPEMTDEQLEEAIKGMGQEVTEQSKNRMREIMKSSKDLLKTARMKGSSTEVHTDISSPEMNSEDFQFALPDGAVLQESVFGGVLTGSKQGL